MEVALEKKLIRESPNTLIFYSPEYSLIIIEFKEAITLDELTYKKNALALLDFIRRENIKNLICNTLKFNAVFSASLEEWIAENINQYLVQIMDKIALIESQNPISQLSLQSYIEKSNKYRTKAEEKFFADEQSALKWILQE